MSLIRAPIESNKHAQYVFPPKIKRFHESVFKMRKRSRKVPHTRGQYSLVAFCYGKINEISSNLDRIESNTCENYMLYMMKNVQKNSFPFGIFRAAVSWYFPPAKKLIYMITTYQQKQSLTKLTVLIRFSTRALIYFWYLKGRRLLETERLFGTGAYFFFEKYGSFWLSLDLEFDVCLWSGIFVCYKRSSCLRSVMVRRESLACRKDDREELDKEYNEYAIGTYLEARP